MANQKKQETTTAIVPQKKELILEGDPETQLAFAQKAASALMKVVESKPKKVIINGKQYLEYGSWQTLARFFGATAGIEWAKPIEQGNKVLGYEARAIVYQKGEIISSAEASCLRSERNWATRDEFALKSMAQTRAAAKALRNAFGWVAELAGYQSTPAEEMDAIHGGVIKLDDIPEEAEITVSGADAEPKKKKRELTETDKKKIEIKELIDKKIEGVGIPCVTGDDYRNYVKENLNLELEAWNYEKIITGLKAL